MNNNNSILQGSAPTPKPEEKKKIEIEPNEAVPKSKIKHVVIGILVVFFIGLGGYLYWNANNQKKIVAQTLEDSNKAIRSAVFELRRQTDEYYKTKKTYQDWQSNYYIETQVSQLGSKLVLEMPDYQTYVIYAKLLQSDKYLCVDSHGFSDEITTQPLKTKCQ